MDGLIACIRNSIDWRLNRPFHGGADTSKGMLYLSLILSALFTCQPSPLKETIKIYRKLYGLP